MQKMCFLTILVILLTQSFAFGEVKDNCKITTFATAIGEPSKKFSQRDYTYDATDLLDCVHEAKKNIGETYQELKTNGPQILNIEDASTTYIIKKVDYTFTQKSSLNKGSFK